MHLQVKQSSNTDSMSASLFLTDLEGYTVFIRFYAATDTVYFSSFRAAYVIKGLQ